MHSGEEKAASAIVEVQRAVVVAKVGAVARVAAGRRVSGAWMVGRAARAVGSTVAFVRAEGGVAPSQVTMVDAEGLAVG